MFFAVYVVLCIVTLNEQGTRHDLYATSILTEAAVYLRLLVS